MKLWTVSREQNWSIHSGRSLGSKTQTQGLISVRLASLVYTNSFILQASSLE